MKLNEIRNAFLNFFESNSHKIMESSSLIPHNDPSLFFTNSGMVQFKDYFTNIKIPQHKRVATSQKCLRVSGKHNDLENVGYTTRHHTFFEMLGNFSFADYFKEEAIFLAWEFLTSELKINKEKLYITIYHNDDEAYLLWKKIANLPDNRIIKISTSDNFWTMGDTGPCGPCTEIYYDNGPKFKGGLPGSLEDGERFVEIWNLVFMQYELQKNGDKLLLPKPCIDTGMGLERIAAVMQGTHDNFEIDLFKNLINDSIMISGNSSGIFSHRVIADHLRSSCFLIADGVLPSNEGRGYVLRRIMRRAMRHIHTLGVKENMFSKLIPSLFREMGDQFPELIRAKALINSTIYDEETKFRETLERGMKILDEEIKNATTELSGDIAFKLYDTYGFPLDLTIDVLREYNISVDEDGFLNAMENQKQNSKAAWIGSGENKQDELILELSNKLIKTDFLGYEKTEIDDARVVAIIQNKSIVNSVDSGDAIIFLDKTPFYPESGGQVGDTGKIANSVVKDTKKISGLIFHIVDVKGRISIGNTVNAKVDSKRRSDIRRNHSATHLLHFALKKIIGQHVTQKGSLVDENKLRFDFNNNSSLSNDQIKEIEILVNNMILDNSSTNVVLTDTKKAIEMGAMALFGEKYEDISRVVSMGSSVELCGGTHVDSTGSIGLFKIINEESISSGIRRITAITGMQAVLFMQNINSILIDVKSILKVSDNMVIKKIEHLEKSKKDIETSLINLKAENILKQIQQSSADNKNGYDLFFSKFQIEITAQEMKQLINLLKKKYQTNSLHIIVYKQSGVTSVQIYVSKDLSQAVTAKSILNDIVQKFGGKGGGNNELAMLVGVHDSIYN